MAPFGVEHYRRICQKNDLENYLFDKYLFRKISIYFTILFIKLGITANQATFLSLLASLGSLYFLTSNAPSMMLAAALLVFAYYMLDHVDGELARYYINTGRQRPSLQGQYFDVLIHKFSTNLMLFFIGISVYQKFGYSLPLFLGFISCMGMSAFPNLIAAQVIIQKVARNNDSINDAGVREVLYLLEKKQEQIKRVKSDNPVYKTRKIISELLFFPGCLLLITAVVILDIFINSFTLFSYHFNLRYLLLIGLTPIYTLNAVRQSIKWMSRFRRIS